MSCDLSVVVISRDDGDSVRHLAASLGRQQDAAGAFEIIVVDDGSAVPLPTDLAGDVPLTVIRRDGDGNRSAARNAGAAAARGRVLAFLDADQEAPPRWVAEHQRWQREFPNALVIGHRRHLTTPGDGATGPWRPEVRSRVTAEYSQNYARIAGGWYLAFGCNFSVPARLYAEIGGFGEHFTGRGFEDSDFGYRAWSAGATAVHNPYAWSWDRHHVVRTDPERVGGWEANRDLFLAANPEPHAQAVKLIDNYPSGRRSSPGQEWFDSFRRFDAELCRLDNLPEPERATRIVTVLSQPDAVYARRLLAGDEPLRIVDGLRDSGLDLDVALGGLRHVEYETLLD